MKFSLPFDGVPYIHFRDGSSGVLSCPTPDEADAWIATPLEGDVLTGTIGEFERAYPFQFAAPGDWVEVALVNSREVVSRWSAERSGHTGMSDNGVEWRIGRPLAGPKACLVDRSVTLYW